HLLDQEYGGTRGLRPDSFSLTPDLFTQLDKNKDGRVRRDEFETLNDVPPHVVIAAVFGKTERTGDGGQETEDEEASERPPTRTARPIPTRSRPFSHSSRLACGRRFTPERPTARTCCLPRSMPTTMTDSIAASWRARPSDWPVSTKTATVKSQPMSCRSCCW